MNSFFKLVLLLLAVFTLSAEYLAAQRQGQQRLDSLLTVYGKSNLADSQRVNLLNNIAFEYNTVNPETGIRYAIEGIELAKKIKFDFGLANCLRSAGVCYWAKSDYYMALEYFFNAMKICESSGNKTGMASTANNIGLVYLNKQEYGKAAEYLQLSLKINTELDDKNNKARNYQNIGNLFNEQKDYAKALEYYEKALAISTNLKNKNGRAINLGNIGKVYQKLNEYDKALKYIFESLALNKELNRKRGIMYNIGDIGETYYLIASQSFSADISRTGTQAKALSQSEKTRYYNQSVSYLKDAIEIGKKINANKELADLYGILSKACVGLDNWKDAYFYNERSNRLKDSIFSVDLQLKITSLELKQERELKDKEIRIQRMQIWIIICALAVITIIAFLIYTRFRIKKKSNEALERKNKLISEQNHEILNQKGKIDIAYQNVKMLSEIGRKITANLYAEDITATVYDNVSKLMNSSVFGIGIYNEEEARLEFNGGMEEDKVLPFFYYSLADENRLAVHCFKNQAEIVIADYMEDSKKYISEILEPKAGRNPESILYLPLRNKDKKIGVITVQSFEKNAYTDYHKDILLNLSIYVAIALENAEAYRHIAMQNKEIESKMIVVEHQSQDLQIINNRLIEANDSKEKYLHALKTELHNAASYVRSQIPKPISYRNIRTNWIYIPSLEIGGDSFGYHWIDKDNFSFYLFDVSGHGIKAALHSVSVLNNLKYHTIPNADYLSPKDVLDKLNVLYQMKFYDDMFFTIWYGVVNIRTGEMTYSTGGHSSGLYLDAESKSSSLITNNPLIGALSHFDFQESKIKLDKHSSLFIYSDGVFEIIKSDKIIFNQNALNSYLEENNSELEGENFIQLYRHVLSLKDSEHLDDDFSILKLDFDFVF